MRTATTVPPPRPDEDVDRVGYVPGPRVVGLSKLARVVEALEPDGVGVVLEAEHTCTSLRGIRSVGALTRTSALRGRVRGDARTRAEFLDLARRSRS